MIDVDDLHVYGGLAALASGAGLFHLGLGLAVLGAGLIALGTLYSLASAKTERERRKATPGHFEGLKTATPPADDQGA